MGDHYNIVERTLELFNIHEQIRMAIIEMGVYVSGATPLKDYPKLIRQIEQERNIFEGSGGFSFAEDFSRLLGTSKYQHGHRTNEIATLNRALNIAEDFVLHTYSVDMVDGFEDLSVIEDRVFSFSEDFEVRIFTHKIESFENAETLENNYSFAEHFEIITIEA